MMIILVTANNYLLMFVGWEGVGVCSYLLVSFWFTRIAANQSSISAFLTNRVGDCFVIIGMFAILWSLGNNQIFKLVLAIMRIVNHYTGISFTCNYIHKNTHKISSARIHINHTIALTWVKLDSILVLVLI